MIEGYCTTEKRAAISIGGSFEPLSSVSLGIPMSAVPGDTVQFHVSSDADHYTIQYMRLRARFDKDLNAEVFDPDTDLDLFASPIYYKVNPEDLQAKPKSEAWQGCKWNSSFPLDIPQTWATGYYAAYLKDSAGSDFYIVFVVRPPALNDFTIAEENARYRRFAMLASTLTWNCYNIYGDVDQYTQNQNLKPPPTLDSPLLLGFQRPFPALRPCPPYPPSERPGDNVWDHEFQSKHTLRADVWLMTWFEDNGYEVDLYTDLDFHFKVLNPSDYAGLILGTHPEYWTVEMRDHLDTYLAQGGNLIYLGGNGLYERVLIDDEFWQISVSGWGANDPGGQSRWLFRRPPPLGASRPERAVLGVAYPASDTSGGSYCVDAKNAAHRLLAKTRVYADPEAKPFGAEGLFGIPACGWEMDTSKSGSGRDTPPNNLVVLAASTGGSGSEMTAYDTDSGGLVYSVGSLNYSQSLARGDEVLAQILKNVLDECLFGSILPWHVEIPPWILEVARKYPLFDLPTPPGPVEVWAIAERVLTTSLEHGNVEGMVRGLRLAGHADAAEELLQHAINSLRRGG